MFYYEDRVSIVQPLLIIAGIVCFGIGFLAANALYKKEGEDCKNYCRDQFIFYDDYCYCKVEPLIKVK
jgi:hypothetical protein